jgi:hypothetical protein
MRAMYDCLGCGHPFTIEITEQEAQSGLDRERTDTCPIVFGRSVHPL